MTRHRFIAGAVCPKCASVDRIVLEDGDRRRRCIACGFSDAMPTGAPSTSPRGRLDEGRPRDTSRSAAASTIRIVERESHTPKVDDGDKSSST